jgi:hypothetical protein
MSTVHGAFPRDIPDGMKIADVLDAHAMYMKQVVAFLPKPMRRESTVRTFAGITDEAHAKSTIKSFVTGDTQEEWNERMGMNLSKLSALITAVADKFHTEVSVVDTANGKVRFSNAFLPTVKDIPTETRRNVTASKVLETLRQHKYDRQMALHEKKRDNDRYKKPGKVTQIRSNFMDALELLRTGHVKEAIAIYNSGGRKLNRIPADAEMTPDEFAFEYLQHICKDDYPNEFLYNLLMNEYGIKLDISPDRRKGQKTYLRDTLCYTLYVLMTVLEAGKPLKRTKMERSSSSKKKKDQNDDESDSDSEESDSDDSDDDE